MSWFRMKALTIAVGAVMAVPQMSHAEVGSTPLIGGLFNSSEVLKNQITSSLSYSTRFARDLTLFTIGGVTLETYLLTLPLDAARKRE